MLYHSIAWLDWLVLPPSSRPAGNGALVINQRRLNTGQTLAECMCAPSKNTHTDIQDIFFYSQQPQAVDAG